MSMETCGDDRFELIEEAKRRLLEATNIEDRPEELAVLDSILFRFWQMGWLDQLREDVGAGTCSNLSLNGGDFICSQCSAHVQVTNVGRSYVDDSGKRWYGTSSEHKFRHCPNCGRKVSGD